MKEIRDANLKLIHPNVHSMYYLANIIVLDDCVAHSECFVLAPSYHH